MMNLREARSHRMLTIQELSEVSGVSTGAICMLERGKVRARMATARKLLAALGLSPGDLQLPVYAGRDLGVSPEQLTEQAAPPVNVPLEQEKE